MARCGSFIERVGKAHYKSSAARITCAIVTRPFFSKDRVTDLLLYERKAATALQKMQDRFDADMAVDFQVSPVVHFYFDDL
jgi:hypothetical protein